VPRILYPPGGGVVPPAVLDTVAPVITFGNDSVGASVTTRYLSPWFEDTLAQTVPAQWRIPRAGTLRSLRVHQNGPAGNGGLIVYTVRINGVATALSVSMASTAADGSDLVDSVVVAAGDLIDIEITKALAIATSPTDVLASMVLGV
jgi:hypothetical protein